MFVLFKTKNKEGIDKFIEFLIKHQSDPIYKSECVENLFINSKLTRIQWDKEVTTCYDVYTSKEFQLIVFETIDIVDKEIFIDVHEQIRTNIEECGGIELRYENPFEKYW